MNGEVNVAAMKKVTIDDLLGRPPIQADMDQVYEFLNQRKILMVKNLWCSLEILPEDIVLQNFTFLNGKKLAKKLKY